MKIYRSIETLPLYNYAKVISTGDLRHLKANSFPVLNIQLHKAWANIQKEVIEVQLKDTDFQNVMNQRKKRMLLEIKAATTNDPLTRHLLDIEKQKEAATPQNEQQDYDFEQVLSQINSTLPYMLDFRTVTVSRFFAELQRLKKNK